jgi:hypothetical protein
MAVTSATNIVPFLIQSLDTVAASKNIRNALEQFGTAVPRVIQDSLSSLLNISAPKITYNELKRLFHLFNTLAHTYIVAG